MTAKRLSARGREYFDRISECQKHNEHYSTPRTPPILLSLVFRLCRSQPALRDPLEEHEQRAHVQAEGRPEVEPDRSDSRASRMMCTDMKSVFNGTLLK